MFGGGGRRRGTENNWFQKFSSELAKPTSAPKAYQTGALIAVPTSAPKTDPTGAPIAAPTSQYVSQNFVSQLLKE